MKLRKQKSYGALIFHPGKIMNPDMVSGIMFISMLLLIVIALMFTLVGALHC